MIKLIGALMIIVSTTLSGVLIAQSYKKRVEDIADFRARLRTFADEIRFRKGIIGDAFEKSGKNPGVAAKFFNEAAVYIKTMDAESAWDLACDTLEFDTELKAEDVDVIRLLGKDLGMSDVEGQLSNIDCVDARLAAQEEKAEQERQKNEPLFKKIGILVGAAVVIILL